MGDQRGTRGTGERGEATGRLSDDRFYRALASADRRRLLSYLLDEQRSTVDELTTVLAGWDAVESGTMTTARERERLLTALRHSHLPLLEDAGLVAYDPEAGTVRMESVSETVADLVRWSVEAER